MTCIGFYTPHIVVCSASYVYFGPSFHYLLAYAESAII